MRSLKTLYLTFRSSTTRTKRIPRRRTRRAKPRLLLPKAKKTILNQALRRRLRARQSHTSANLSKLRSGRVHRLLCQFSSCLLNLVFTRQTSFLQMKMLVKSSTLLLVSPSFQKFSTRLPETATRKNHFLSKRCSTLRMIS
jgi:hypothetical protein